jgi:two-component SAPR family response regulator
MKKSHLSIIIFTKSSRLFDSLQIMLRAIADGNDISVCSDSTHLIEKITTAQSILAIIDANMFDREAWQFLSKIKNIASSCHCIILTHTSTQHQKALEMGAENILNEGFTMKDLTHAMGI